MWIEHAPRYSGQVSKALVYLENARVSKAHAAGVHRATGRAAQTLVDKTWFGRLHTLLEIRVSAPIRAAGQPGKLAPGAPAGQPIVAPREAGPVQLAQFQFGPANSPAPAVGASFRSVEVRPRSGALPSLTIRNLPDRDEAVAMLTNGINIIIDDVVINGSGQREPVALGRIDIEADQIVAWSQRSVLQEMMSQQGAMQPTNLPLELYVEGNIVFRQGDRVVYANRMYYNVQQHYGVVLDAEMLTPVPEYEGLVRIRADVLRQVNQRRFEAVNAAVTSSRMGVPRYWFQSGLLTLEDNPTPAIDPLTGGTPLNEMQEPEVDHHYLATSRRNRVYVGGVPVLFWPVMATDLETPSFYLKRIKLKSDRVFGQQIMADWNLYHLLGIRNPLEGSEWTLSTDYLSERGLAGGTQFRYATDRMFGIPGPASGLADLWGIKDDGLDNLGADRRAVLPEKEWRGRAFWQHHQEMPNGFQVNAELGLISDRNFLEQYFHTEWDTWKDQATGIELKQYLGMASWSVAADVRVNDFFMETERLPQFDHYLLGRPLADGLLTWHAHSKAGYLRLRPAEPPTDPGELAKFDPLQGEVASDGVVASSRHELSAPLTIGALNVTPYVLGEAAYYQRDIMGDDLTRFLGQVGVRNSLAFWRTRPEVQSVLFNLNGLSHKVQVDSELLFAEASEDLASLPRYDQLDDNATEFFRRRFFFDTFGGMAGMDVAPRFDDRLFAARSGIQRWVTAPTDIAEDLMQGRFSVRQRLQTKRGLPGQERIIDWMELDIDGVVFPKSERDNFNVDVGMVNYDYRWHLGDRLTLLSDGYFDFFNDGLRTLSAGGVIRRPERGNLYIGYRSIEGPVSSSIFTTSLDYRMSRKWIVHFATAVDFGEAGNIGQRFAVTRIGESTLLRLGFHFDASRDDLGLNLQFQPRFLPARKLRRLTGVELPPVGSRGVE